MLQYLIFMKERTFCGYPGYFTNDLSGHYYIHPAAPNHGTLSCQVQTPIIAKSYQGDETMPRISTFTISYIKVKAVLHSKFF